MSKFIPYHIVCPMASCTRSNTCARYANYLKAKAEADSFEILNLDHLKIAGDSCPLSSRNRTPVLGKRFRPSLRFHPQGQLQISQHLHPLYAAPFLQGKEWRVCTQS